MSDLTVDEQPFGAAPDGTPVQRWVLRAPSGFSAAVLTYGAILHSFRVPHPGGPPAEVVLQLPSVDAYAADRAYLGAVVGRYANRIAYGRFTLDGIRHELVPNEGPHTLHGGPEGFHRKVWSASGFRSGEIAGVVLRLRSADGDMGFPGNLGVEVTYYISRSGTLGIRYRAVTDRPTVVNLTQHAYWNLSGDVAVADHELSVEADAYLPVDEAGIPVGAPSPAAHTPFALGRALRGALEDPHPHIVAAGGLDHCFVLRGGRTSAPRPVARLTHAESGRSLEVRTTEPGLQVYTANTLGEPFGRHRAVCLETQHFPDAPNRPGYPSPVLRPGEVYRSATEYHFATTPSD